MSQVRRTRVQPGLEQLEQRENPTTWFADNFDQVVAPALPPGWMHWANDGQIQYITTRLQSSSGPNALASLGTSSTEARFWSPTSYPADFGAALNVRSNTVVPLMVIARGQNLNTATPSYLAAMWNSSTVQLVEARNGVRNVLGSVRPQQTLPNVWLRVSVLPAGEWASVQVQRADTNQYLTASGTWQTHSTDAIRSRVTHRPTEGFVGIGRDTGGNGMTYLDDFAALAPVGSKESFDTTTGVLPTNWQQWGSDRPAPARVGSTRSLSPASGLSFDGGSLTQGRAWLGSSLPADLSASASVYTDSLIPAGVLLRGTNLNTAAPSYYSLTITRGLAVQLKRVQNGVETLLGSLRTSSYVSGSWVRLTLTATGDQLQAVVYRSDTRQWLGANGLWRSTPDSAIRATDSSLRGSGFAGVLRSSTASGSVWLDDFDVQPVGARVTPNFTLTSSQTGTTFREVVTFTATAAPNSNIARIEFRLDNTLRSVQISNPATWDLDTLLLSNGVHRLTVRAVEANGNESTQTLDFTVQNEGNPDRPGRPEGVRNYSHIRLAQLAYTGNPMDEYELTLAKNSLDLIVANPNFLPKLNDAAADTPKVIYTNVSNLYQSLLTDWLAYADRNRADRESAFFHVSQPTAFTGASQSSVPVNQFWGVYRQATSGSGSLVDLTGEARGTRPAGVEFAGAGQAVHLGWTDRFREVNVVLNRAANQWTGQWEYVNDVNPDGSPRTWKTLMLISDGTAGFTRNGAITFDPPSNWKPAKLPGTSQYFYYVRAVTTAGTGPNAKTILGRDYVNANGLAQGTIPAFDVTADRDGDGYLNDVEWANRKAGFNARFVHESRLFYPYYGQMRYVTNPAGLPLRRWAADYHIRLLAANPLAKGVFVDNSNGKVPFGNTGVKEATDTFTADMASMINTVVRALPDRWVISNTSGSQAEGNLVAAASTGVFEEFILRPNDVNWSGLRDVANLVAGRLNSDTPSPYLILDSHPGNANLNTERTRMGTLAYYYLLADPDKTFLMFFGGYAPASAWNKVFVPAATTDVGLPTGTMRVFATGTDPENPALTYQVFSRDYGKAKVLFKPRSYTLGKGTGTTNDTTATIHDLGGRYRILYSDGALGQVVTRVTLRNGEGVVLMKA